MAKVDVGVLLLGFANSCSRVFGGGEPAHEALVRDIRASAGGAPPVFGPSVRELGPAAEVDVFIPMFEALHWATSLEYRIAADWPDRGDAKNWYRSFPAGETVRGVRFARNRVHHQWAEAIMIDDADRDLPARFAPWIWQPRLPDGRADKQGERVYMDRLSGEPVAGALGRLLAVFGRSLRHLSDAGHARSELLDALLPAIDSIDPEEFSREAITNKVRPDSRAGDGAMPVNQGANRRA